MKGPELGAQPSVYLAVAEELQGVSGRYYDVMTEKEPAPNSLDQEVSSRLWEASARLVGLELTGGETEKEQAKTPTPTAAPAETGPHPCSTDTDTRRET